MIIAAVPIRAATPEDTVLSTLEAYDQIFLSGYRLDLTAVQPSHLDESLGCSTFTITLSGDGIRHASRRTVRAAGPVSYVGHSRFGTMMKAAT